MKTSSERSKLWVEQETSSGSARIQNFWWMWDLDDCPAGLDYLLLHLGAELGIKQVREWAKLCMEDFQVESIHSLSHEQAMVLIDRIELLWRRRLRSSPGWETYRIRWVNQLNRVIKRARNLATEAKPLKEKVS